MHCGESVGMYCSEAVGMHCRRLLKRHRVGRRIRASACLILALSTLPTVWSGAEGQELQTRVAGRTSDGASGAPVASAEVRILERGLSALTGPDGSFVFPSVPHGTYTIRVDRIGYRVRQQTIDVGPAPVIVEITLTVAALELAEIIVTPGRFGVMGDATVRQQQTLTREDLETTN